MKYGIIIFLTAITLLAETLFEVKDSSNNPVLRVSTDGLAVMNLNDTIMVISTTEIKAVIDDTKALSRKFSVSTTSSKKGLYTDLFDVSLGSATMREGTAGEKYTYFSPQNIFIGLDAGSSTTDGLRNVFLGTFAGKNNTRGWRNIFIGDSAGVAVNQYSLPNTGSDNVFIGSTAGKANATGFSNVFIGTQTGKRNIWGSQNVLIGWRAGYSLIDGHYNTNIGYLSGASNAGGDYNTFYGYYSGSSTTGSDNTFLGSECGMQNETGSSNTFIGKNAGWNNETGNNNVLIGMEAGKQNISGSNNTFIGYSAGSGTYNNSVTGNVCIGYLAGASETSSNKLHISNTNSSTPLIGGTFPNTDLTFTANKVSVVHPSGTSNGLYIKTSYNSNTDPWNFYQWNAKTLGLFYSGLERGSFNITTGAYSSVSDLKLKKNIEDISYVTDKVMKLQPKRYNFTSQKDNEKKYIGLIAQDVKELFPEFVYYNEESDTFTMDYAGLSVVALQAIKEQNEINIKQQNEIDELKRQIEELREMIVK